MDANALLELYAVGSALALLIRAATKHGLVGRGWIFAALFTLALAGTLWAIEPELAGYVSAAAWTLLVIVPSLLQRGVQRAVMAQDFGRARRLALFVRLLHPLDGLASQPEILRALELARAGRIDEALAILERHRSAPGIVGRTATMHLLRLGDRWEDLVQSIDTSQAGGGAKDPGVLMVLLRALGEVGALRRLIDEYAKARALLEPGAMVMIRAQCSLFLFAFTGRRASLERIFGGVLAAYSPELKRFWLATADAARGEREAAQRELSSLTRDPDAFVRRGAERRLKHMPVPADPLLDARDREVLEEAARDAADEQRYRLSTSGLGQRRLTLALIAANFVVFGAEVLFGGSMDPYTLHRLGAMVPRDVFRGQVWRLFAALFLHFGPAHLVLNMLGLALLGAFIEGALGMRRTAILYFASGIGSMLFLAAVGRWLGPGQPTIGASGAIMGLCGAGLYLFYRGWRDDRARAARRLLTTMIVVLALQVLFDLLMPQVSFLGHASGLILGFAVAAAMRARIPPAQ